MYATRKAAYVFNFDMFLNEFYSTLDHYDCPAGVTIPDKVLVQAIMNCTIGYSKMRGTAVFRVINELVYFGIPPLIADELFCELCQRVKNQLRSFMQDTPFFTEHYWVFVDETSVCVVEK